MVLNQLMAEVGKRQYLSVDPMDCMLHARSFFDVRDILYIDSGNSDKEGTYLGPEFEFSIRALKEFVRTEGLRVTIHTTPYTMKDFRRPHVVGEHEWFSHELAKEGVSVELYDYFAAMPPTLDLHFSLLHHFMYKRSHLLVSDDGEREEEREEDEEQ
jgi:hypothetical protein